MILLFNAYNNRIIKLKEDINSSIPSFLVCNYLKNDKNFKKRYDNTDDLRSM